MTGMEVETKYVPAFNATSLALEWLWDSYCSRGIETWLELWS